MLLHAVLGQQLPFIPSNKYMNYVPLSWLEIEWTIQPVYSGSVRYKMITNLDCFAAVHTNIILSTDCKNFLPRKCEHNHLQYLNGTLFNGYEGMCFSTETIEPDQSVEEDIHPVNSDWMDIHVLYPFNIRPKDPSLEYEVFGPTIYYGVRHGATLSFSEATYRLMFQQKASTGNVVFDPALARRKGNSICISYLNNHRQGLYVPIKTQGTRDMLHQWAFMASVPFEMFRRMVYEHNDLDFAPDCIRQWNSTHCNTYGARPNSVYRNARERLMRSDLVERCLPIHTDAKGLVKTVFDACFEWMEEEMEGMFLFIVNKIIKLLNWVIKRTRIVDMLCLDLILLGFNLNVYIVTILDIILLVIFGLEK